MQEFYDLKSIEFRSKQTDLLVLMRASLLLHDIGKPLGYSKKYLNSFRHQHQHTPPIHEYFMKHWEFSPREVQIAQETINHDLLGETIQGKISPTEAAKIIREKADKVKMLPIDFFQLQTLFYVSDASYYPNVRSKVFVQGSSDEKLKINNPNFDELSRLLR